MIIKTINDRCKSLVEAVKNLSEMENQELFKMIYKENSIYTRNNNGIFINLAWISEELLNKLELYVDFCNTSRNEIKKYESICDVLNSKLNNPITKVEKQQIKFEKLNEPKDIKDKEENDNIFDDVFDKSGNKISSSMKFSLLKKKFSKQYNIINQNNILQNELYHDNYVI